MVNRLILNEELEKDSPLACKKCYHILVRKPNLKECWRELSAGKSKNKNLTLYQLVGPGRRSVRRSVEW